jgi:hypothetical protein
MRSTGPRQAWRFLRLERELRALVPARGRALARGLWLAAAKETGAEVTEREGRLEIRSGDSVTTIKGQITELNTAAAIERAADKPDAYAVLARAGLLYPSTARSSSTRSVPRSASSRDSFPCVVKPARGSGDDGVTGGIRTAGQLRRAALSASRLCRRLLVERQAEGEAPGCSCSTRRSRTCCAASRRGS